MRPLKGFNDGNIPGVGKGRRRLVICERRVRGKNQKKKRVKGIILKLGGLKTQTKRYICRKFRRRPGTIFCKKCWNQTKSRKNGELVKKGIKSD